jgi:hypothetical protein
MSQTATIQQPPHYKGIVVGHVFVAMVEEPAPLQATVQQPQAIQAVVQLPTPYQAVVQPPTPYKATVQGITVIYQNTGGSGNTRYRLASFTYTGSVLTQKQLFADNAGTVLQKTYTYGYLPDGRLNSVVIDDFENGGTTEMREITYDTNGNISGISITIL